MISFFLPIDPPKTTSQGAGKRIVMIGGRPRFFKGGKAQSAENDLTLLCAPYAPPEPLTGAIYLQVDYVFPWRKSESKKVRQMCWAPHTTRPDASNLVKMLEDVMTRLRFWEDDSQIADLRVTKSWGDEVGIRVEIGRVKP